MNRIIIKQFIAGVIALAIFGGVVSYMFGHTKPVVAQAQIVDVVMARGIDMHGNPVGVSTKFDPQADRSVYAVVDLKNATKQTEVAYVRYYNGRYIDSKVTLPSKDSVPTVFFNFEKGVGSYPSGNYTLVTYVDGKRGVQANYTFGSGTNKVGVSGDKMRSSIGVANVAGVATATGTSINSTTTNSGKVAFVIEGTIASTTSKMIYLHITNASKNLLVLKGKNETIPVTKKTHITKNGKDIKVRDISMGSKVKVFGIYDKKSSGYISVHWIKIQ